MKNQKKTKQQGFFDLGLSLAVLALSGAFAYAVAPEQDDRLAAQDPRTEVVAEITTSNGEIRF